MSQEKVTIIETALFSAFAGLGGILSYCLRQLNLDSKPIMSRAILEGFSSAFVGLLAMFACKALELDWYWSGVVVGVFGWLGANASITVLTSLVRKKLGVDDVVGKDSK